MEVFLVFCTASGAKFPVKVVAPNGSCTVCKVSGTKFCTTNRLGRNGDKC
jgi:hypothetical protein